MMPSRSPSSVALVCLLSVGADRALAQEVAAPLASVDVTRTLVYSTAEVVALGGAGVASATGAPGLVLSPAAAVNRRFESVAPVTASLVLLQTRSGEHQDLANLGTPLGEVVRTFTVGLAGGYRSGAGGLMVEGAWHDVGEAWVGIATGHASAAVSMLDGRLSLGAGPRMLGMRIAAEGVHYDYFGAGFETGAVFANWKGSWNFALTLRTGVSAGALGVAWPGLDTVRVAPEVLGGVAWSNRALLAHRAGGIPLRVVADVVVDAPVPDAVSVESALSGTGAQRGATYTSSPRLGAEVDVWRDRLRLRGGTYLEPSRTSLSGPRPHATGGLELRLFRIAAFQQRVKLDLAWQIGVDYAPRYFRGAWLGINLWQNGQVGGTPGGGPLDPVAPPKIPR